LIVVFCIFLLAFIVYSLFHLLVFAKLARLEVDVRHKTQDTRLDTGQETQNTRHGQSPVEGGRWMITDHETTNPEQSSGEERREMTTPISVIICARNEADNLRLYLPSILEQDYPDFEVIVVNDHSTDNTLAALCELAEQYPKLFIINFEEESLLQGKRAALLKGIQSARYEHLLLTDADCQPVSKYWIQEMAQPYIYPEVEIVLGYSPYQQLPGFLNKMIRFETLLTAIQYISYALWKAPYMGVGRNLSYRKSTFMLSGQFRDHNTLSGDDDLLISEMSNGLNTAVVLSPGSFMLSQPKTSFKEWLQQKRRHSEAGFNYILIHKIILSSFLASMVLFHILLIPLLLNSSYISITLLIIIIKTIIQYAIYVPVCRKLDSAGILKWLPALDFCLSYFFVTLGILSVFKIKEWTK
jgi:glycosyltransferase involved in cell wall biosynthesis